MAQLKVPSLQHLAKHWRGDSGMICRSLVNVARNPPVFSYQPVYSATRDMLLLKVPQDQVSEGIRRKEKRKKIQENLLSLIPLISSHFNGANPDFVNSVSTRMYPIGSGLMVPFQPPLIYGVGGQLYFPWFSFWRSNPLANMNLRLFVTLVEEILRDDPDLEDARFEILDFSCPSPKEARRVSVIDTREIERLSPKEKVEMLEVFVDGYTKAIAVLNSEPAQKSKPTQRDDDDRYADEVQMDLFT